MRASRGVEMANIFQLGLRYSEPLGCMFLDREGVRRPVWMGSYGIGVGRLLGCIAEEHRDELGLRWPPSVAPFPVELVALGCAAEADSVYRALQEAGIEALYDDREERAGVKFMDADLIGLPLRLTVSERSLKQGGVEWKLRAEAVKKIVPMGDVVVTVKTQMAQWAA
jgi:prolyl-tRNA synthetase